MAYFAFDHVSFTAGERTIIKDVSFTVDKGEYITIVGSSGGGKSTLLKLCSDLISLTAGTIYFKDKKVTEYSPIEYRHRVGYCFQQPYLFGSSVMGNMKFPYKVHGAKLDMTRVEYLFHLFSMPIDYIHRDADTLSGGEKQRICLIRSLLFEPDILLLDEVTSALDEANTALVEQGLQYLHEKRHMTIMQITHSHEQSERLGTRRMTIHAGEIVKWEDIHRNETTGDANIADHDRGLAHSPTGMAVTKSDSKTVEEADHARI